MRGSQPIEEKVLPDSKEEAGLKPESKTQRTVRNIVTVIVVVGMLAFFVLLAVRSCG